MQLKKNPNADLNKDRNLYFVIGLTLVLGLTWGAVEYKSYERILCYWFDSCIRSYLGCS